RLVQASRKPAGGAHGSTGCAGPRRRVADGEAAVRAGAAVHGGTLAAVRGAFALSGHGPGGATDAPCRWRPAAAWPAANCAADSRPANGRRYGRARDGAVRITVCA